jgi:CXXX repeat modification system protein
LETTLLPQGEALVLIMLDDGCPSPCYCFGHSPAPGRSMSTEALTAALDWIAAFEPTPPAVFFMVSDPSRLEGQIKEFIREMAERLILPLMSRSEQERLEIPATSGQTVVASSLDVLERHCAVTRGRSCIVHVSRAELPRVYEVLNSAPVQRNAQRIRIRPYEIDRWRPADLEAYANLLAQWDTRVYRLMAGGTVPDAAAVRLEMDTAKCPAVTRLITIGPDNFLYPCPAFYAAGPSHRLGSLDSVDRDTLFTTKPAEPCNLCHEQDCPACLYGCSGLFHGEISVCDVSSMGRRRDAATSMRLVRQSAYLFDGLRIMKTNDARRTSESEGKDLSADEHVFDITREDFARALCDIRQAEKCVIAGTPQGITGLIDGWRGSPVVPTTSRQAIFYRRTAEILRGFATMGDICRAGRQKPHAPPARRTEPHDTVSSSSDAGSLEKPLSPQEVSTIQTLYQRLLGWEALLTFAMDAQKAGFSMDGEITIVQREATEARRNLTQWFDDTAERNEWPVQAGYVWEIDFESTLSVSKARLRRFRGQVPPAPVPESPAFPIMTLGSVDADICRRLFELRETPVITARRYLAQMARGTLVDKESLAAAVEEIGRHELDVRRWFHGMAREYDWPTGSAGWRVTPDYKQIEAVQSQSMSVSEQAMPEFAQEESGE